MERKCLKINNIKLKEKHSVDDLKNSIIKSLRLSNSDTFEYDIAKKSVDSRHKPDIYYVYSVFVYKIVINGQSINLNKFYSGKEKVLKNVSYVTKVIYEFPYKDITVNEDERPVVIGFGPAGIFNALMLSRAGLKPIVYERGLDVDVRTAKVKEFWEGGKLDVNCNVQFGEGGAGTFSDGKLNTQISDTFGRIGFLLNTFIEHGAGEEIRYLNKPHIGTDVLSTVVKKIREEIISLGGEVHFGHSMIDILTDENGVCGVLIKNLSGDVFERKTRQICLSIGHSARETFYTLFDKGISMESKPFAVGVRIMHNQGFINKNAYGFESVDDRNLPVADYKVTYKSAASGKERGVYSFCMCPGGFVVNASSEEGMLAVNGMSYSLRDSDNANSAIIVTVSPEDYGDGVLDGIEFQRKLEKNAFIEGEGKIPVQTFGDFELNNASIELGRISPCIKGEYKLANLNNIFPDFINVSLKESIHGFAKFIEGFDDKEAVLAGVESRTSSPVRIIRGEDLQSVGLKGLFPCGEGAGYAGGITSAGVDGIKVAEAMIKSRLF